MIDKDLLNYFWTSYGIRERTFIYVKKYLYMGKEGENEKDPYWRKEEDKKSKNIFLSFVAVTVVILLLVVSLGVYTYISWRDLQERPKLRAQEGKFEFHNATDGKANITVHLTLVNEGEEKADSIDLEWFVMEQENSSDNVIFTEGNRSISSIKSGDSKDITFKLVLPKGAYKIAYRTYEEDLFTYEGRQDFMVKEEDTERGTPGASDEDDGAGVGGDGMPMISTPLILLIIVLYAVFRWRFKDE